MFHLELLLYILSLYDVFPYSKIRVKLGLKPLQVDDGANKENGTTCITTQ